MNLLNQIAAAIPLQPLPARPVRSLPHEVRKRRLRLAGIQESTRLTSADIGRAFSGCDVTVRSRRVGAA